MLAARHDDDDDDNFVYTQLKVKTVLFQIIQFSVIKFSMSKGVSFQTIHFGIQKTVPFLAFQFSISTKFKCQITFISSHFVLHRYAV